MSDWPDVTYPDNLRYVCLKHTQEIVLRKENP
jgi:hypothetical protein